ncbi:MAG: sulfatase-like hydrolase/transferase [Anaerolineales bacterium]|nr:MAG: sulfatase-like hydrolase/transferase [Anaerolineales bacterium]
MAKRSVVNAPNLIALAAVVLIAVAPILALHNINIQFVHYTAVLSSLRVAVIASVALLLILWLVFRNLPKAAAVTSLSILLFFLYGHVFSVLSMFVAVPNLLLSGLWTLFLVLGVWLIARGTPEAAQRLNSAVLVAAGLLVVFNLANILWFEGAKARANQLSLEQAGQHTVEGFDPDAPRPDVYYIILDAHTRADVLAERFGHDSSAFLQRLEGMGFYVAQCSQTNYWRTGFSVGSALRMEYFGEEFDDVEALPDWKVSPVLQSFKQLGYQIIAFETRATHNQELGEDVMLSRPPQNTLYENFTPLTTLNDFEANLIKTTWLHSWLQLIGNYRQLLPDEIVLDPDSLVHLEHYRQTYFILEELPRVAFMTSPKFVYVHILVPHEPFVFDASGRYLYRHTDDEFVDGYRNNVEFIDNHIADVIQQIKDNSATPPVIILQGDHGPNGGPPETLLPILNSYHFPGVEDAGLYPSISPVNSFRVLFSSYFGADYELVPDMSYYGRGTSLKEGELITEDFCN